jgi:hypothetical protein
MEPGRYISMAKVTPPAFGIEVEPFNYLFQAQPATAPGLFTNALLEAVYRFGVDADMRRITPAGKRKPGIGSPPRITDGTFFPVDSQSYPVFNKPCDIAHHPVCGFKASNINYNIVPISDEAQTALFQLFVKLVQYNIRH